MKKLILSYSRYLLFFLGFIAFDAIAQAPDLVNPNATQEAKDVYNYIYNAKYQGLITGQHNYAQTWLSNSETAIRASKLVKDNIGEWPGLWGSDFSFTDPTYTIEQLQEARQKMINVAKSQAAAGSLITLTYHMVTPKLEENQGWTNVQQARLTMEEYEALVTPGTPLYNNWKRNMDRVIPFLKELETEGIAVVWRPYHEMNGLFWWGGGESAKVHFKQLWINTYEYMVNNPDPSMKLNNLIWFWSPNHFTSWNNDRAPAPWFPGLEYVDMLGVDDYWWTQEGFLSQGDYDYLVNLAEGKPLAIGEGFNPNMVIPDPAWMMEHRPEYRWFMLWDGEWINDRISDPVRKAALTEVYQHENAINQNNVYIPAMDIEDLTPPSIPANLGTTSEEWNAVSLAWEAATDENGVSGYEVFVNGEYKKFTFDLFTTVSELSPATEYTFTVKARDHYMNRSEMSTPLVVETPVFEAIPPTVPQNVTLMGRSETTISLSWNPSTSNSTITGYQVYVDGTLNKTVSTLGTTITGLLQGEEFNITVKAVNEAEQLSEASQTVVVSTYNPEAATVIVNDTEFTYNGTWGTSSGSGKYMGDDHWSRTTDAFYTYTFTGTKAYIFAAKAPHHGIAGISLNGGEEVMVDYYSAFRIDETIVYETGELPLGNYTIKVRVSGTRNPNSTGEVIASDRLDYVQGEGEDDIPPTKPTDLAVTDRSHNSVSLSWTASTDNSAVFGYDIYVDGDYKMTTPNTTATVTGLSELTTYSFTVVAKDGFGNGSEPSDAIEATTRENMEVNLVMNGGFEDFSSVFNDDNFWFDDNKNGNAAIETDQVFEGEKAVKLGPGNWGWVSQRLTGWEAGKTYVLSAYGKVAAAGNSVRMSTKFDNTDLEQINFTSTEYAFQSIQVTIPENATSFQIYLTNRNTGTGYIDNVSFVLLDQESPAAPTDLSATVITGSSVSLSWLGSTDNVGVIGYEVYVDGIFNQAVEGDTTAVVTGLSGGTEYSFTVAAKDGAGNLSDPSAALEVSTAADLESNLLQNGGFEDDLLGWRTASGDASIVTEMVAKGLKSAKLGPLGYSTLDQKVTEGFETGKKYRFSATVKSVSQSSIKKVALQVVSGTDFKVLNFTNTEFEEQSTDFIMPETATEFTVYLSNRAGGEAIFDEIKVVLVDEEAPTVPTDLSATDITANAVSLAWLASTDNVGVIAYEVFVDGNINQMVQGDTSAVVTGLSGDTEYAFTVVAKDGAGNASDTSVVLKVSTLVDLEPNLLQNGGFENDLSSWRTASGDATIITEMVAEGAKSAKLGPLGYSTLDQKVTEGFEPGKKYRFSAIVKSVSESSIKKVALQVVSGTDFKVLNFTNTEFEEQSTEFIMPETATDFTVYLSNRSGGEAIFDEIKVVLVDEDAPSVPTNLTVTERSQTSISISWSPSTDNVGVVGYDVYIGDSLATSVGDTPTSAIFGNLEPGTAYVITVTAKDAAGNISEASESLEVTTEETEVPLGVAFGKNNEATTLKVYPNPFENELAVQLMESEKFKGDITFSIHNLYGITVYRGNLTRRDNYFQIIDTSDLHPGFYILRVTGSVKRSSLIMKK